ncbi:hypothetical protein EV383_1055 [Pseudonocardia sediminis]|uniref:Uncharacterized protein n=1 Tax=Pseudonocardia sediminis TaxID=1397368 RepID=A0A4Q7UQW4_PSEST|nr:DUF5997 family protein [Pseudonocardia sediminis]RZT84217.1 hypothetical protein EV383_1055 [Pseudonocardia sediminis]
MTRQRSTQTMKPATAAKKLGVHLDATPEEFRAGVVSRDELDALQAEPPEWLRELRANGPHPRPVVADRLGVSISGLARAEITEPLTTAQIAAIKEEQPEWLRRERNTRAESQRAEARLQAEKSGNKPAR